MAFTLESLGFKLNINNDNFRENVINYCKQKINNEKITISTQLLLSQKSGFTTDIEKHIYNEFNSNLLKRRMLFLKDLNKETFEDKLYNFLTDYLEGLKSIDIIFSLSNQSEEMKSYGNSNFIQSNIELLSDLIIFHPKIKKLLSNYIKENIIENKDLEILKIFKKLENYGIVIFDELSLDIIDWSLKENDILEDLDIYNFHEKELLKLGHNIYKIKKINYFVKKNFPNKNYSNIFIKVFDIIFEKNFSNILKHNNTGLGLLKRYLKDLTKIMNFLDKDKCQYYTTYLENKVRFIFRQIKNLDNFIFLLETFEIYNFTRPEISSLFVRNINDDIFTNILNTIINLDVIHIEILGKCFNDYLVKNREIIILKLKYQVTENIWNLNDEEINKIYVFLNSLNYKCKQTEMIKCMLNDKIKSNRISRIMSPHNVYHFSRGLWDFPMDNDYLVLNNYKDIFNEEISALKLNFDNNKEIVLFMTKGTMIIDLEDNIGKLECIFLPIQAFIIKKLINSELSQEKIEEYIKSLGIENYNKVLDTISDLITFDNNIYKLKDKLPFYGNKNYADLYFIETQKIIEKKIEEELVLSMYEFLSTNIISYIKNETSRIIRKHQLYSKLKEKAFRDFSTKDFEDVLSELEKKEYIIVHDDIISYQAY